MSVNVLINGDRTLFVSKMAVDRFKKDVRSTKLDMIDPKKYLKNGNTFVFNTDTENTINVKIITVEEEDALNQAHMLEEKRKNLKSRLKKSQMARSQLPKQKLASLKRSVPGKLYNAYLNLISKYQLPGGIPAPDEVINNVDKYRTQIATVMGTIANVSDNNVVSNEIKHYFNTLGEYLSIEPMTPQQEPIMSSISQSLNSDTEDEDEPPELV